MYTSFRKSNAFIKNTIRFFPAVVTARPVLTRWILAGPVTIIASILFMAGMALWVPEGAAKVNNIALPVITLPIIWSAFFFYTCIDENLSRASAIMAAIILLNVALVFSAF